MGLVNGKNATKFSKNVYQMNIMKDSPVLLLIDIQNDYFHDGKMTLTGAEEAARQAEKILYTFREKQLPIVHIAHEAVQEGATFFLPGTGRQKIHTLVQPQDEEILITKNYPNSFLNTPLLEILRQHAANRLVITGMMTHMCVDATTRAAKDLGFACTLAYDATATRDLTFAGKKVSAAQVLTAFSAALSTICDAILTTDATLKVLFDE